VKKLIKIGGYLQIKDVDNTLSHKSHNLIVGIIKERESKSASWSDNDEENAELNRVMDKFENNNNIAASDDWAENEEENAALNKVMDKYEGTG